MDAITNDEIRGREFEELRGVYGRIQKWEREG